MTIFGFLWVTLIFLTMFTTTLQGLIILTLLSSTLQCSNVLVIGESGIGPQVFTSAVFVVRILILKSNFKIKIRYGAVRIQVGVIALFLFILFSSVANSVISENYIRILQLFVYIICYFCMYRAGGYIDKDFVYKCLKNITIFLLCIGIIQILITTGYLPRLYVIQTLFYNDTLSDAVYFTRDNYARIMSTYMEPSYYAGFLVGAFYFFLAFKEKRRENLLLLMAILVEIILTFSSTAYGAFLVVGVVFAALSKEGKLKIYILVGGLIGGIIMFIFFYNILDIVIFSKMESGSGIARYYWNRAAVANFESSPWFGVGYKVSRASSLFYTLLAELGIIGLLIYGWTNFHIIRPIFKRKEKISPEIIGISMAIFGIIVCQMIAVPDLDICTYWMWMNLLALSLSANKTKVNKDINRSRW